MQLIIDQIVNNVLSVEGDMKLSPEHMHEIITASVRAVLDTLKHHERVREETTIRGPIALEEWNR